MTGSVLDIYIDGAARGNPGPAAIGLVILDADGTTLLEAGECIGSQTNNVAEYTALIRALEEAVVFRPASVRIRTDSQLIARQVNGQYRVKKEHLLPLWERACELMDKIDSAVIEHIPREENHRADALANRALDTGRNVE